MPNWMLTIPLAVCLFPGNAKAQCTSDDAFEPNDTCAAAVTLTAGYYTNLVVGDSDPDFFKIVVGPSERLDVIQDHYFQIDQWVWVYDDAACTNLVAATTTDGNSYTTEWTNATDADVTLYLHCELGAFDTGCHDYDLRLVLAIDPCLDPSAEDQFGDNSTCDLATPISTGSHDDLFVSKYSPDIYTFQLAPGGTADITLDHVTADGALDIYLYDDTPGACGDGASYVAASNTVFPVEHIAWTNTTGQDVTYHLLVEVCFGTYYDCNTYELDVVLGGSPDWVPTCAGDGSFDIGAGPVACPCGNESVLGANEGCVNSTGVGARLSASGTSSVTADDLVVHVDGARPGQPAMLVQGASRIAVPFRDGVLCAGNPTERLAVLTLDAAGSASTTTSIVSAGAVSAGDTRHYQLWYRDPLTSPCGSGSNLSSGISVVWR
jgi:hypothetical protein